MDFNVQNSPAFGTKVIQTKEFKRLGKFAKNELGPKIEAALKDYADDHVTVKLGSEITPNKPNLNKVTIMIYDDILHCGIKDSTFLSFFRPIYWKGKGLEKPTEAATKYQNDFIRGIKLSIDNLG